MIYKKMRNLIREEEQEKARGMWAHTVCVLDSENRRLNVENTYLKEQLVAVRAEYMAFQRDAMPVKNGQSQS